MDQKETTYHSFIDDGNNIDQFIYSNKTNHTNKRNNSTSDDINTVPIGAYDPFNLLNINNDNSTNSTIPTDKVTSLSSTNIPTINTSIPAIVTATITSAIAPATNTASDIIPKNIDDINLYLVKGSSLSPQIIQTPTLKIENSDTFEQHILLNSNDVIHPPNIDHYDKSNNKNSNILNTDKFLAPTTPTTNVFTNTFNNNLIASQNSNLQNSNTDNNNININININSSNVLTNTNLNTFQNGSSLSTSPLYSPSYLSPSSYLSTNDTDNDDLLSVYSNNSYYSTNSSTSNVLLPINSHGLKHVNDLKDLDYLLENIEVDPYPLSDEYYDINSHLPTTTDTTITTTNININNSLNLNNDQYSAPIISIEEFNPINNTTTNNNNLFELASPTALQNNQINWESPLNSQNNMLSPSSYLSTSNSNNFNNTNSISDDNEQDEEKGVKKEETDDATKLNIIHEEIISGGKIRRKSIPNSLCNNTKSLRPRSRSRGRKSLMSLDERARSLSANRDKLLKLADLKLDDADTSINSNTNNNNNGLDTNIGSSTSLSPIKLEPSGNVPKPKDVNGINLNQTSPKRQEENTSKKSTVIYACSLCDKTFTRPYNLKSHLRTHTNERPFVCTVCGKAFARQHDRKRHEDLHSGKKRYVCGGKLKNGKPWGCGKKFARSDALGRHFKTESGKQCIAPLYQEAARERAAAILQQQQQQQQQ